MTVDPGRTYISAFASPTKLLTCSRVAELDSLKIVYATLATSSQESVSEGYRT